MAQEDGTGVSLREARRLLEKAVALDPYSGDALATLAGVYGMMTMTGALPLSEGLQTTLQYGQKALMLDPNSADALSEEGTATAVLHHDWSRAETLFRRAIAIKPSDALTHQTYAWAVLWPTGRLEEARQEQQKSIELDPLNGESRVALTNTLYFQHQYGAAIRVGKEALALNPNVQHVADNLLRPLVITGRVDEISALMQRFWKDEPDHSFALAMRALAAGDQTTACTIFGT
jgi:Tfp pilus assembly protein PilF